MRVSRIIKKVSAAATAVAVVAVLTATGVFGGGVSSARADGDTAPISSPVATPVVNPSTDSTQKSDAPAPTDTQQAAPAPEKTTTTQKPEPAETTTPSEPAQPTVNAKVNTDTLPAPPTKMTICHRTDSVTNPYVQITVDTSAVDGVGNSDHYGEHQGPLASTTVVAQQLKDAHTKWGDIIPPLAGVHNGHNWPEGEAIYKAGCVVPTPPTCVENPSYTYTFSSATGSGVITVTGGKTGEQLCKSLYVRAVTYSYDTPVTIVAGATSWPQTQVGYNDTPVNQIGKFTYSPPQRETCRQYDAYASFSGWEALAVPQHLLGSHNPYEPAFLHETLPGSGPNPTWSFTSAEGCNPPPPKATVCTATGSYLVTNLNEQGFNYTPTGTPYADTRTGASYDYVSGALHTVTTTGASKLQGSRAVDIPVKQYGGKFAMNFTFTSGAIEPGINVVIDADNNGTNDVTLVAEPNVAGYMTFWTNKPGYLPASTGGQGGAYAGTQDDLLALYPNAHVKIEKFSLGSGVVTDGKIISWSTPCNNYTYDKVKPTIPVEGTPIITVDGPTCKAPYNTINYNIPPGLSVNGFTGTGSIRAEDYPNARGDGSSIYGHWNVPVVVKVGYSYDKLSSLKYDLVDPTTLNCTVPTVHPENVMFHDSCGVTDDSTNVPGTLDPKSVKTTTDKDGNVINTRKYIVENVGGYTVTDTVTAAGVHTSRVTFQQFGDAKIAEPVKGVDTYKLVTEGEATIALWTYTFNSTPCPLTVIDTPPAPIVNPVTCTADGSLPPLKDGENYTATYNRAFNGPGSYKVVYTAKEGTTFKDGTTVSYDLTVATKSVVGCITSTSLAFTGSNPVGLILTAFGLLVMGALLLVNPTRRRIFGFVRRFTGQTGRHAQA